MKGKMILPLLLAALLTGCSAKSTPPKQAIPDGQKTSPSTQETQPTAPEASSEAHPEIPPLTEGDHVMAASNTSTQPQLWLEVIGPADGVTEFFFGVREIRVWDGETLIQSILTQEALDVEWPNDISWQGCTETADPSGGLLVQDLNFDGHDDLCLPGWIPNNSIPYYCWLWDTATEQYTYAFRLQEPQPVPETQALASWYKYENGVYYTDYYRINEANQIELVRRDVEDWLRGTQDDPLLESYKMMDGQLVLQSTGS